MIFIKKDNLYKDKGPRDRQTVTCSTGVTVQPSLHIASDTQVCTRVPNALGSKTSGLSLPSLAS